MTVQWLTTAPNPRVAPTGPDAGQRGWKLHAVETDSETFKGVGWTRAVCGVRPAHGWGLDLFIFEKCARCSRKIAE